MKSAENDDPMRQQVVRFPARSAGYAADIETAYRENEERLKRYLRLRLGSITDAEDVAQIAFLRLWQRRDGLHRENLAALLFTVARNIALDLLRTRTRNAIVSSEDGDWASATALPDPGARTEEAVSARRELMLVTRLLDELPEKTRFAFVSLQFHGLSYRDIAYRMGITENMVRKHVARAAAHCAMRMKALETDA